MQSLKKFNNKNIIKAISLIFGITALLVPLIFIYISSIYNPIVTLEGQVALFLLFNSLGFLGIIFTLIPLTSYLRSRNIKTISRIFLYTNSIMITFSILALAYALSLVITNPQEDIVDLLNTPSFFRFFYDFTGVFLFDIILLNLIYIFLPIQNELKSNFLKLGNKLSYIVLGLTLSIGILNYFTFVDFSVILLVNLIFMITFRYKLRRVNVSNKSSKLESMLTRTDKLAKFVIIFLLSSLIIIFLRKLWEAVAFSLNIRYYNNFFYYIFELPELFSLSLLGIFTLFFIGYILYITFFISRKKSISEKGTAKEKKA